MASGSGPTINFQADALGVGYYIYASLQVTNAENGTTSTESTVYVDPYGDPRIGSAVLDTPTLTVTEIDPGATVVAGTPAQFDIHLNAGRPGPMMGNIIVAYWTQDGSAIGSENATEQSPANYQSTGVQSYTFEAGETDLIVPVTTYSGMVGGNFSLQVGHLYDPFAAAGYNGGSIITAVAGITPSITRTYSHVTDRAEFQQNDAFGNTTDTITIFVGHARHVENMIKYYVRNRPPQNSSIAVAIACQSRQSPILDSLLNYYKPDWFAHFPWTWSAKPTSFEHGISQLISPTSIPSLISEATSNFSWKGSPSGHYVNVRIVMDYDTADFIRSDATKGWTLPNAIGGGPVSSLVGGPPTLPKHRPKNNFRISMGGSGFRGHEPIMGVYVVYDISMALRRSGPCSPECQYRFVSPESLRGTSR